MGIVVQLSNNKSFYNYILKYSKIVHTYFPHLTIKEKKPHDWNRKSGELCIEFLLFIGQIKRPENPY
jgi:hypothetical protein